METWIPQIGIAMFGMTAVFLVCSKEQRVRRWGPVCGLIGQPFWIWSSIAAEQWGILVLTAFYTYSWWRGFRNNWMAVEDDAVACAAGGKVE